MLMSTCYPGFLHWTVYKTLIWVRVLAHLNIKICMDGSHRLLPSAPEEGSSSSAHGARKDSGGNAPSLRSPLTHCPAQRKCSITTYWIKEEILKKEMKDMPYLKLLENTGSNSISHYPNLAVLPVTFLPKYPLISEESAFWKFLMGPKVAMHKHEIPLKSHVWC